MHVVVLILDMKKHMQTKWFAAMNAQTVAVYT